MQRIEVSLIPKGRIRSCNNCTARNFESEMFFDGEVVDKIYNLEISQSCIALCEKCLREVSAKISVLLREERKDGE